MKARRPSADYDSPWKDVLAQFFRDSIELCFPGVAGQIDWTKDVEFLDKELQKVAPAAEVGRRTVDKLARVWRRDGVEQWVLLHTEVQAQPESAFAGRMFDCWCRIGQRYHRDVVSLAILADNSPKWRPNTYECGLWGCRARFEFPTIKLLDLAADEAKLLRSRNPFGVVVLAHVRAMQSAKVMARRSVWKWDLVRGLYERAYPKRQVQDLFRFIDWVMALPASLESEFDEKLLKYEKEKHMPYVTSIERRGRAEGGPRGGPKGGPKGGARRCARTFWTFWKRVSTPCPIHCVSRCRPCRSRRS